MIFAIYALLRRLIRLLLRSRPLLVLTLFALVIMFNALLFYWAEGVAGGRRDVDLFESLYWSIITSATVGYGDVTPRTAAGKLVAMEATVTGIAMFTLLVSTIAEEFLSSAMKRAMGLGRLRRVDLLVIGDTEACREVIEEVRRARPQWRIGWVLPEQPPSPPRDVEFVVGDPSNDETLVRGGVERAGHVVICLSDDSKAIHTVLAIRRLRRDVPIAALANTRRAEELLRTAGASMVVPARIVGRALASAIFEPTVTRFIEEVAAVRSAADLKEYSVSVEEEGASLGEVARSVEAGDRGARYVPLAVVRGGEIVFSPSSDFRLRRGDRVVFLKSRSGGGKERSQQPGEG